MSAQRSRSASPGGSKVTRYALAAIALLGLGGDERELRHDGGRPVGTLGGDD